MAKLMIVKEISGTARRGSLATIFLFFAAALMYSVSLQIFMVLNQVEIDTSSSLAFVPIVNEGSLSPQDRFLRQVNHYFEGFNHGDTDEMKWLRDYLLWHQNARAQFPDKELLENSHAPCLWIFSNNQAVEGGGLVDRMQCLVDWLREAHEKRKLILFKWYNGKLPLEAFLVPHLLNFTVPIHPTTSTSEQLDANYGDATNSSKVQIRRFRCDDIGHFHPMYGFVWRAVFLPSPRVQKSIDETKVAHGLVTGGYDAVHCRFGHPATRGKLTMYDSADFKTDQKNTYAVDEMLLALARHGIECTEWVANSFNYSQPGNRKIYFYGDSANLVQVVLKLSDPFNNDDAVPMEWAQLRSRMDVVGRPNASVAHLLNPSKDLPSDAFLSTFVDLYLAAEARCISIGVGRFGLMAAKMSGTTCWTRYQVPVPRLEKKWGMHELAEVPVCPVDSTF